MAVDFDHLLPKRLAEQLRSHLKFVRQVHQKDLADGFGRVPLPHSAAPCWQQESTNPPHPTPCATRSPLTCLSEGKTFEPSKNSWDIAI
jgi:hypothetical protein